MKEYLYYICYGSNLLSERFHLYIAGGESKKLQRKQLGCKDKTLPKKTITFEIPYDIYYAKESKGWNNQGVAFLDTTKPGVALGKGYLITKEQYHCLSKQEGAWYDNKFYLGEVEGYPLYTLTSSVKYTQNNPSEQYLEVIRRGLVETYKEKTLLEINQYLERGIV